MRADDHDRELLAAERQARAELTELRAPTPRWLRVALGVAAVAATAGVIAMLWSGRAPSDDDFQRAAAARVNALLTINPDQPGRTQRILAGATGEFHDEFAQSADAFSKFVKQAGAVSDGRVQGTGVTARTGDQAEVLVLASIDLPASRQAPARSADFRLRVVVADEDGVLKLAKVQYLP
ncbi:MAG: hypothetical protein QM728_11575 [Gordonia sp. (in: high G+C Gram-positive bacteria)]|uniref:hypothetical protein n=1 Tax=Gordonia sp. (in: high G+C Gram-positive bacteria) TaxID=84139 RepID=UPI0039E503B8